MEFLKELKSLFSLDSVNYDTANRKTLDALVKKVKLQQRFTTTFVRFLVTLRIFHLFLTLRFYF